MLSNEPRYLTTGMVARLLKVAPRTVSKWIDSGKLSAFKLPGSMDRRVQAYDLLGFCEEFGLPKPEYLFPSVFLVRLSNLDNNIIIDGLHEDLVDHTYLCGTFFEAGIQIKECLQLVVVVSLDSGLDEIHAIRQRLIDTGKWFRLVMLIGEDQIEADYQAFADYVVKRPFDVKSISELICDEINRKEKKRRYTRNKRNTIVLAENDEVS